MTRKARTKTQFEIITAQLQGNEDFAAALAELAFAYQESIDNKSLPDDTLSDIRRAVRTEGKRRGRLPDDADRQLTEAIKTVRQQRYKTRDVPVILKPKTAKAAKAATTKTGGYQFVADAKGVNAIDDDNKPTAVCSPLWVEAMTRDERSGNWGRLLKFIDPDGKEHTWAMPQSLLAGTNSEYEAFLRDQGVQIFNRKLLSTYLAGKSDKRVLVVARTGWHKAAFVFPDGCVGSNDGDQVFHQSDAGANHLMTTAGTLEDWQQNISRFCPGNSRLLFAVAAGFAASLLAKVGVEGGGFHFRGDTSKGKTTLLLIAGSVWGGGSDNGFIRRWRATINGLESVAASHNDALLCLDELAEVDPREAGETAYMLANGQGKIRQTKNITLRKQLEWRTLFLSSGEISLADHLSQAGKKTRGGMEVRLLDLPCDPGAGFGVFENLHHFDSPKEMADHLRHAARQHYGVAIRQFIARLTKQPETEIKQAWDTVRRSFHKDHCPKDSGEEVGRACGRFALVGFAREAATEAGITGWDEGEAINTAATIFKAWLDGRGVGSTTEAAAIQQVDLFLEQHGDSRFRKLGGEGRGEDQRTSQNQAGYRENVTNDEGEETTIYYITPEFFRSEVYRGFNVVSVAKWLLSRKRLRMTHDLRCEKRTPDGKKKMYAVTETSTE